MTTPKLPPGEDVEAATLRSANPWLASEDIFYAPITVTIARVQEHKKVTLEGGRKEDVLALHLATRGGRPLSKALILSRTNIRALKTGLKFGEKCRNWIGKDITLRAMTLTKPKNGRAYGIRIVVDDPTWQDPTVSGPAWTGKESDG